MQHNSEGDFATEASKEEPNEETQGGSNEGQTTLSVNKSDLS